ncbi:hypothetical protein [Azospirillum doebereinerae]
MAVPRVMGGIRFRPWDALAQGWLRARGLARVSGELVLRNG